MKNICFQLLLIARSGHLVTSTSLILGPFWYLVCTLSGKSAGAFYAYFSNLVIQWLKYLKLISAELSCSLLFVCLFSFLLILPKNDLCIKLCKCHNKIFIKLSCRIQHNQWAASQIFCTKSRNFSKWPSSKSRWLWLVFQFSMHVHG